MKEAVKGKKEAFWSSWSWGRLKQWTGTGRPIGLQLRPSRGKKKKWLWEELREAMEKDFWLASRKFWQTIWQLIKGKQGVALGVFSRGGDLLPWTRGKC